ncbi:MAG: hypothetical protein K8W52_38955, partial [Deltaproteobacteria bacterium]|nr:hypothetical protein [Deltaproteobacteria bacterium]
AVWRRVELVQRGLGERIVFAVGQQLRVSEEALDEDLPGALYVYKRTMAAKAILTRVEAVAAATIAVAPVAPELPFGEPAAKPAKKATAKKAAKEPAAEPPEKPAKAAKPATPKKAAKPAKPT